MKKQSFQLSTYKTMSASQPTEASFACTFFGPFHAWSNSAIIILDTIIMVSIFLVLRLFLGVLLSVSALGVGMIAVTRTLPLLALVEFG